MDDTPPEPNGQLSVDESFERLLWELVLRFVDLQGERVDGEIRAAQRRFCEALDLQRSALWQALPGDPRDLHLTHVYDRDVAEQSINELDGAAEDGSARIFPLANGHAAQASLHARRLFPWMTERVLAGVTTAVSSLQDLPAEAAIDAETLRGYGTESTVIVPLRTEAGVIGCLSFAGGHRKRACSALLIRRFELLAQVFARALNARRMSQERREDEARLKLAARSAQAGFWELDLATMAIRATTEARQLYNLPSDGPIGFEQIVAAVHPDDRAILTSRAARAQQHDEGYTQEYRLVLTDGSTRWLHSRGRPFATVPGGAPDRVFGVTIDITERKLAEERLRQALEETQRLRDQLQHENVYLRSQRRLVVGPSHIVGRSQAIRTVIAMVEQVAPTASTVLLLGETGTGKGRTAEAIHDLSARRDRPMVRVNCAAIPPTLIESELFGREKGAYTGALTKQVGRFELAHGSSIFLDEVGELPPEVQVKLLRVIDERRLERLGSPHVVSVDVRIIAATNQDLQQAVRERRFREDLYYRLNVFPIRMPSLKDRAEDIPLLVRTLVDELSVTMGRRIDSIPRATMTALMQYHWPGNIRELRNVIERAMILSSGPVLEASPPLEVSAETDTSTQSLRDLERGHVLTVLQQTGWRIRGRHGAASILGLPPTTLENRMKRLGIVRPGRSGA